ncbi:MAG TPA: DEAD/DEAH box helicase [Bacillus sp. (in: firmicutes)]|uniref:DEAD/DEAH box helicase n=1 Tax=Bacillus litorisediminis TaxID=2922713 RepID=UPI001FAB7A18|nr:DEAD/DEAH box helicase [Bacillus litorisediminis]HWO74529.1 DEAD/DEAH box helicase [Bacillus sp. (in: firmicutes)]
MEDFYNLHISDTRIGRLKMKGITSPTLIQEKAIPAILEGKDVIGRAQTGTGKTLAFVLPILEKIDVTKTGPQALILTPTRELALQITNDIKSVLSEEEGIRVLPIYGGQDVEQQLRKLKGNIQVIVATPGRLLDHLRRETVQLSKLSTLVLDEADQMLHIGFLPEVEQIIKEIPSTRQTLLFSATVPDQVRSLAKKYLTNPVDIRVKNPEVTVKEIDQSVILTTDRLKQQHLFQTLIEESPFLAMVFCRTKRRVSKLNEALQQNGFNADELHGDLSQAKRERVMKRFRDAEIQYLVATDVAARGLDVSGVTHVFNYDIPEDVESYIHRIGRTGRAGEKGKAVTFVAPKDEQMLGKIEKGMGQSIDKKNVRPKREIKSPQKPYDRLEVKRNSVRNKGKKKRR